MESLLTLDDILQHSCHNPAPGEDGYSIYRVELHCTVYYITAKLIGYTPAPNLQSGQRAQYIIRSYSIEDC